MQRNHLSVVHDAKIIVDFEVCLYAFVLFYNALPRHILCVPFPLNGNMT